MRRGPQRHKAPKGHKPAKPGWKRLSDGRVAELQLLIDGRVQLVVGRDRAGRWCWWEYLTEDAARAALAAWNGIGEPGGGWLRSVGFVEGKDDGHTADHGG